MSIVVDRVAGVVYGRYDFGSGVTETAQVVLPNNGIDALQSIGFTFDYTSPPTTPGGAGYLGGEFDDLRLAETIP